MRRRVGFWRLIFLKQCVLATSGLHSLFRRVFFWVALPSTPFVSLWIRPWSRQLRVWLAGLTPRPSVSGVSSGVFSDPHPDSDPHPNPKGLVNSNSHPNPHPGAVSAACGSQARLLAPLRLRRFPRHPCAQQCLDCSWLQICCLVFNDAALILDSQSTASFPPFIALSLGAHGPALRQKGLVSILRPLRRRLPAGRQPRWAAVAPLLLVSCCVFAPLPADSFSGLLLGPLHHQGPPGLPPDCSLWAGTVGERGSPAPRRLGPWCVGWCADRAPSAGSGFGRYAFPPDRGPPGLSSRGAFISFPAPHPPERYRASLQFGGSPETSQDLLFTAGPLLGAPARRRGPGLCSELLSVLAALCSCYDIGLGWRPLLC